MEHVSTAAATIRQQQQQQQQQQQLQQHQQEQQQQHENQQQFCLRWHNHQTSLLSTLPILLDQSHLTDVTISAEGRTLRAHRVVLSACSTFFFELFRTLDSTNHPIIIIPGASFAAIVALLTFMYSGEVNVYEEQIPMLLSLAETLGIKGLADVQHNKSSRHATPTAAAASLQTDFMHQMHKDEPVSSPTTPSPAPPPPPPPPPQSATPTAPTLACAIPLSSSSSNIQLPLALPAYNAPLLAGKVPTPLESFFLKSLQFYPNLLPQPLNFSQNALNKTTQLLAKYQQQCNLYHGALAMNAKEVLPPTFGYDDFTTHAYSNDEDYCNAKRQCLSEKQRTQQQQQQQQQQSTQQHQQKDIKRIDKIVENLRKTPTIIDSSGNGNVGIQQQHFSPQQHSSKSPITATSYQSSYALTNLSNKTSMYATAQQQQTESFLSTEDQVAKLQQQIDQFASCNRVASNAITSATNAEEKLSTTTSASATTTTTTNAHTKPPANSKLYATCFICHKQLSNQYNLRVHLETHQNVRYACNVCTHVSRSKDALRKHVSYRHPGAPSPCETDARRKRATKALNASPPVAIGINTPISAATTIAPSHSTAAVVNAPLPQMDAYNNSPTTTATTTTTNTGSSNLNADTQMNAAAQLSSAYMFLPNQFHLAAAAAAAVQQQQQQQQQQHLQHAGESMLTPASINFSTTNTSSATTTTSASEVFACNNNKLNNNNNNIKHEASTHVASPRATTPANACNAGNVDAGPSTA